MQALKENGEFTDEVVTQDMTKAQKKRYMKNKSKNNN